MELITWRGTPGVGDFMWALNSAHRYCYDYNVKVNLEFQWEHDEDYLHHFEEEETIIERLHYIHNFYHRKDDVKVTHVFNANGRYRDWRYSDDLIKTEDGRLRQVSKGYKSKKRFWFQSNTYSDEIGSKIPKNDWIFREDVIDKEYVKNKVVIWRPIFNAEVPRSWKNFLTVEQWDDIISLLRQGGLDIVELTYRTPVSEAMYHISTCRQVICYDGMWHYIARNYMKPMIVISTEGITNYHTPHCLRISPLEEDDNNIFHWINDIPEMIGKSKKKALKYGNICRNIYK
jgi:hypothetical protein